MVKKPGRGNLAAGNARLTADFEHNYSEITEFKLLIVKTFLSVNNRLGRLLR